MKFKFGNSFLILTVVFALFSASTSAPKPWVLDLTKTIDVHVASEPVSDLDVSQTINLNFEMLGSITNELNELGFTLIPCRTDLDCEVYEYGYSACLDVTHEIERILHGNISSYLSLCTAPQTIDVNVVLELLPSIESKLNERGSSSIPCHTDLDCHDYDESSACFDATKHIENILHVHLSSHLSLCNEPQTIDVYIALKGLPSIEIELNELGFTSIPCHTDLDCDEYESSACLDATRTVEHLLLVHLSSQLSLCTYYS